MNKREVTVYYPPIEKKRKRTRKKREDQEEENESSPALLLGTGLPTLEAICTYYLPSILPLSIDVHT